MMFPSSSERDFRSQGHVGDFGDKFRKAREKKELSLDDVSNVTKISARMLRAIEEEHFDDLPGGVFNKGFIRAYAKHLGMDAEEAVTDYLTSLRQAQVDAHEVWEAQPSSVSRPGANGGKSQRSTDPKPATKTTAPKSPAPVEVQELPDLQLPRSEDIPASRTDQSPSGIPWKIVAAATLVIALGISLWIRHSHRTQVAAAAPATVITTSAPKPVQQLAAATQTQAPTPPAAESKAEVNAPSQSHAEPASTSTTPSSPAPNSGDSNDVTVKQFGKPISKPVQKSAPSLSLVIRAAENSWISVFADGQLVTQETLIAPAHTSVRGSREISVRVGNAAGISFVWNGQEIPAQGAQAEVRNFIFDADGMHLSTAAPSVPQVP
jgi:transcriptional regulator with XRE-family HTH domain